MLFHVLLEGEHEFFGAENLQKHRFLEISQIGFPFARQGLIFRIHAGGPVGPSLIVGLHVLNDALHGFDVALSTVHHLKFEVGQDFGERIFWLFDPLFIADRLCASQKHIPAHRRNNSFISLDRRG